MCGVGVRGREKEGGNLHIDSKYRHFDSSAVDADKEV